MVGIGVLGVCGGVFGVRGGVDPCAKETTVRGAQADGSGARDRESRVQGTTVESSNGIAILQILHGMMRLKFICGVA